VEKIHKTYSVEPIPKWGLDYRLLHSRPETAPFKNAPPSLQHILHLSHMRSNLFVAIDSPVVSKQKLTDTTKPTNNTNSQATSTTQSSNANTQQSSSATQPSQSNTFSQTSGQTSFSNAPAVGDSLPEQHLFITKVPESSKHSFDAILTTKMALLWTPKLNLGVSNGWTFRIIDCTIRLGEVRASANQHVRAIVVAIEIQTVSNSDGTVNDEEKDRVQWEIGKVCQDIGIIGAREAWGFGSENDIIKAWCEILKLR
jgi:hypothetical protein